MKPVVTARPSTGMRGVTTRPSPWWLAGAILPWPYQWPETEEKGRHTQHQGPDHGYTHREPSAQERPIWPLSSSTKRQRKKLGMGIPRGQATQENVEEVLGGASRYLKHNKLSRSDCERPEGKYPDVPGRGWLTGSLKASVKLRKPLLWALTTQGLRARSMPGLFSVSQRLSPPSGTE